jgi:hypothetical protein
MNICWDKTNSFDELNQHILTFLHPILTCSVTQEQDLVELELVTLTELVLKWCMIFCMWPSSATDMQSLKETSSYHEFVGALWSS